MPSFIAYLEQLNLELIDDEITKNRVLLLKDLFQIMSSADDIVTTSTFVTDFHFMNYTFRDHHDAPEALTDILQSCFPQYDLTSSDQSIFRIQFEESIACDIYEGGCGESVKKYEL